MATSKELFQRRKRRIRNKLNRRRSVRPRLSVFRSGKHIYAQLIDDTLGKTVAAASSLDKGIKSKGPGSNKTSAGEVGKLIAERALAIGVNEVVFDRGGYRFHGRVKALADAAREQGLSF